MKLIREIHDYLRSRGLLDAATEERLRASGLLDFGAPTSEFENVCPDSRDFEPVGPQVDAAEDLQGKLEEALEAALAGARVGAKSDGGKPRAGRSTGKGRVDEGWLAEKIRAALATTEASAEWSALVWLAGLRAGRADWPAAAKLLATSEPRELARRLATGLGRRGLGLDAFWRVFGYRPDFVGRIPAGGKGPALAGWRLILDGTDLKGLGKHAWVLGTPEVAMVFHLLQAQRRLRRACGWVYAEHPAALAHSFRRSTDTFAKETFLILHNAQRWAGRPRVSRREVTDFLVPETHGGVRMLARGERNWNTIFRHNNPTLIDTINAACFMSESVTPFYLRGFPSFLLTCPVEWIRP